MLVAGMLPMIATQSYLNPTYHYMNKNILFDG